MKPTAKQVLYARRADLVAEARRITTTALDEKRRLTEIESARDAAIDGELQKLDREIARHELCDGSAGRSFADWQPGESSLEGVFSSPSPARRAMPATSGPRTYAELFGEEPTMGAWEDESVFWRAVRHRLQDERLEIGAAGQTGGADHLGGFALPSQLVAGILDPVLMSSPILREVMIEPMLGREKSTWSFDGSSAEGGILFGGLTPTWSAETAELTEQSAKLKMLTLKANKLALLVFTANELRDDSPEFAAEMERVLRASLQWGLELAVLRGSGAGEPLGALADGVDSRISVAPEGGQPADTITYANVKSMAARLHPTLWNTASWWAHPSCLPQLLQLERPVGTGGDVVPVVSESGPAGGFAMLGRPLYLSEKCFPVGDAGDLVLASFNQYVLGMRRELAIETSMHAGFTTDRTGWRGQIRADGSPRWLSAYQPLDTAADTLSWCVILQART